MALTLISATLYGIYRATWTAEFRLRYPNLPLVKDSKLFDAEYQEALFWGTYRPGFYCGVRAREPGSLAAGLMWSPASRQRWATIRHHARNEDGLQRFGWLAHDPRAFGVQSVWDGDHVVDTAFLKRRSGGYGGDWALRINVSVADGSSSSHGGEQLPFNLYYYLGELADELDGGGGPVAAAGEASSSWDAVVIPEAKDLRQPRGALLASGWRARLGRWRADARVATASPSGTREDVLASVVALESAPPLREYHELAKQGIVARYKTLALEGKGEAFRMDMASMVQPGARALLLQVQCVPPCSLEVAFSSMGNGTRNSLPLLGDLFAQELAAARRRFDSRFDGLLGSREIDHPTGDMLRAALAETLGSMAYFYGSSTVALPRKRSSGERGRAETASAPLFTAVPSRPFFPRGFLWDEGFHGLIIQRWDPRAAADAIAHWLDIMNEDGWIPREQALGAESRSRVPAQFLDQLPEAANPPTLFLPLMAFARALRDSPADSAAAALTEGIPREALLDFLDRAWPRLLLWLQWYVQRQAGPEPGSFRWRGRDGSTGGELNPKTLASGLDDYPRASHPGPEERHVDLRCWLAFASTALHSIGVAIGAEPSALAQLGKQAAQLGDYALLTQQHWSSAAQAFLDFGMHTEDVALQRVEAPGGQVQWTRVVTGAAPRAQYVPHVGYNSIFPLALQLMPWSAPELPAVLRSLEDAAALWTPFGLRSLSAASTIYQKHNTERDPPYWRGAVWININYLVASSLYACQRDAGTAALREACGGVYKRLRGAVLRNVAAQYQSPQAQYIWEQYDDRTGVGRGTHPFGWSSLVVLLALELF